jgi:hypothetical protein
VSDQPRKVLFVGFWTETLKELVDFLEVKEFQDRAMVDHMKELLDGKEEK